MAGKNAQGTILSRETSLGSGVFVPMANVTGFDGPNAQVPDIDTTDLGSTAKEFTGGLVDYGDLSMDVNFDVDAPTHEQVFQDMEASPVTQTNWRITWANSTKKYTWKAYPKSFPLSGAVDGIYKGKATLKLCSQRVVT